MTTSEFDLLVIGEINPDIIVTDPDPQPVFGQVDRLVDGIALVIGSSSVIFACGAARLGLRTAFFGTVGDDPFGRFMLSSMADRGIDVTGCIVDPTLPTGVTVVLSAPQDRATLTALGTIGAMRLTNVAKDLARRARHVHVGSYFLQEALQPDLPDFFRSVRQAGGTTSLDSNWDPTERWNGGLEDLLVETDVFLPNSAEARKLTGCDDDTTAGRELLRRVEQPGRLDTPRCVVVKQGAQGAVAFYNGQTVQRRALRVEVADTTGAGDSFDAGFVYGWLAGWPLVDSLDFGIACGSLSSTRVGGTEGQPTVAQARAALESRSLEQ